MELKAFPVLPQLMAAVFFCPSIHATQAQQYEFTGTFGINGSAETGYFDYNGDGTSTPMDGTGSVFVAGITINVSAIDGNPVSETHTAFCAELEQPFSEGTTYTFDFVDDPANIRSFAGGLTNTQVGQLEFLFDNHYAGPNLAGWGTTNGVRNEHICQLALWEITHDIDLSFSNTTGSLYFTGVDPTVAEAQTIIGTMNGLGAAYFDSYDSTTWDINGLEHVSSQDLVYAELIPEPSTALLFLVGGIFFLLVRRPRRSRPGYPETDPPKRLKSNMNRVPEGGAGRFVNGF